MDEPGGSPKIGEEINSRLLGSLKKKATTRLKTHTVDSIDQAIGKGFAFLRWGSEMFGNLCALIEKLCCAGLWLSRAMFCRNARLFC